MPDFVLEIGVEEMPARFVPKLADELLGSIQELFKQAMIPWGDIQAFATPRRIAVYLSGVQKERESMVEEVSGPPKKIAYDSDGNLSKAGQGFARTQGVEATQLYVISTDKGEYVACNVRRGGGQSMDSLPAICVQAIQSLSFPKKMRWGVGDFAFGRPMRWIVALFDEEIIPFELGKIVSGRTSIGHRVMGATCLPIPSAKDYLACIRDEGAVVLDPTERAQYIKNQGNELAQKCGGRIVWNDSLLEEVSNLVEQPLALLASFEEKFLELPREVLLTSMEKHQKSFGVEDKNGDLLNKFLTTLNLVPDEVELVRKGWERVLRARLEDARFFWEADSTATFDMWQEKLENVVFIQPLGSMASKVRRLEKLCSYLLENTDSAQIKALSHEQKTDIAKAGSFAKCDLVSEMVIEFDSLQGIMGGIYAKQKGLGQTVAETIAEHYLPAGPDSELPQSLGGAVLSIADKADTLAGCFGLNMIPTGANDPYALRRAVLGIIRIILEHNLRLNLGDLLEQAQKGYAQDIQWKIEPVKAHAKLLDFFAGRLRAYFSGLGLETRVIEAGLRAGFTDIVGLKIRLEALEAFTQKEDFEQAVLTFKRAANIIRKQGGETGQTLNGVYAPNLFVESAEKEFAVQLEQIEPRFAELWQQDDFLSIFGLLRELRPVVDNFFDQVMVMCDDTQLRDNRLNLLASLLQLLRPVADFDALQV